MPPNADPTNREPSHHVTLEEVGGGNKYGLILADANGEPNHRAIKRDPIQRTTLKTSQGSTRYSDFSEPFAPIDQADWQGGRGQEDFERDRTRYFDGKRLNTWMPGQAILGPQEVFSTGYRSAVQLMPGSMKFRAHTSTDRYFANKFTTVGGFTAAKIRIWMRRPDYSSLIESAALYTDSGGSPGSQIAGASGARSHSDISDHSMDSALVEFTLGTPAALSAATTYWVVLFNSLGFPELGGAPSTGTTKVSTDGSAWSGATGFDLYFRVTDADAIGGRIIFRYKNGIYMVTAPDDDSAPKLYLNGDRGTADSNAGQLDRLIDASKNWTTNQFSGKIVMLTGGPGQREKRWWRKIISNTATELLVTGDNWIVAHGTTTEYVILGTDEWLEITGHGMTKPVTDVVVSNKDVVYFAQSITTNIRRFRAYTNGTTWTNEFADDGSNKADYLRIVTKEDGTRQVWRADTDQSSVSRASPQSWGTNLTFGSAIKVGSDDQLITGLEAYGSPETLYVMKEDSVWSVSADIPAQVPLREMASVRSGANGRAHLVHGVYLYFSLLHSVERYYRNNLDDVGPSRDAGLPSDRQGPISALLGYPGIFFAAVEGRLSGFSSDSRKSSILTYNQFGWHELYRSSLAGKPIRNLFFEVIPGPLPDRLWFEEGTDVAYVYFPSDTLDPYRDSTYRFTHEGHLVTSWIYADLQDVRKLFRSLKVFAEGLAAGAQIVQADYQLDGATEASQWTSISGDFDTVPVEEINLSANDDVTGRRIRFRIRAQTTDNTKSPKIKATVVETLPRIQTKFRYALTFVTADNQLDLQGKPEGYRVDQLVSQLDTWANSPTVLVLRSNFRPYDNKRVLLDPSSLRPFEIVAGQVEKQIGTILVEEI